MSLPARPLVVNPGWTLRVSLGVVRLGYVRSRTHLFDGVRCGCEYFRVASMFRRPTLTFHSPSTLPTCAFCRRYSMRVPLGVGPAVYEEATARMVTHAFTTRDPHVTAVALRMLGAQPAVEPVAHMLENGDSSR